MINYVYTYVFIYTCNSYIKMSILYDTQDRSCIINNINYVIIDIRKPHFNIVWHLQTYYICILFTVNLNQTNYVTLCNKVNSIALYIYIYVIITSIT